MMNGDNEIRGSLAPWGSFSVENLEMKSPMELYVLEHQLEVCSIPKHAIKEFTHSLIQIAFLPDSRLVNFLTHFCIPLSCFFNLFIKVSRYKCGLLTPKWFFKDFSVSFFLFYHHYKQLFFHNLIYSCWQWRNDIQITSMFNLNWKINFCNRKSHQVLHIDCRCFSTHGVRFVCSASHLSNWYYGDWYYFILQINTCQYPAVMYAFLVVNGTSFDVRNASGNDNIIF